MSGSRKEQMSGVFVPLSDDWLIEEDCGESLDAVREKAEQSGMENGYGSLDDLALIRSIAQTHAFGRGNGAVEEVVDVE